MRKMRLFLVLGLMTVFSAQSVFAENTVYTSYNSSTKTLTYYYDDHYGYSDRPNSVLFQPTSDIARWADYHDEVTKVVIDASMANAELPSLRRMFYGGGGNYLSNVTSITGMSNLKTATVTSMESMFYGCDKLTSIDVSGFNTANVTLMDFMFYDCSSLTSLDLSNFNTAKVTDMRYMFCYCKALKSLNISSFNTAKVARMQYMFNNCSNLTSLDLMKFRFDALINTSYMFAGCSKLVTIYCGANLTEKSELTYANSVDMFKDCTSIMGGGRTPYDYYSDSNKDKWCAHPDKGGDVYGYFTTKKVLYAKIEGTTMYIYYNDDPKDAYLDWNPDGLGSANMSSADKQAIKEVSFTVSVTNARPTTCRQWFYSFSNMEKIWYLTYLNPSECTDMRAMFSGCSSLTELDMTWFKTDNATTMSSMFYNCNKLKSLNLSEFKTGKVTSMYYMFYGCSSLESLYISSDFNTANVTNMICMFYNCSKLASIDVSNFNTSNVTSMQSMFYGCSNLENINVSNFVTNKVTNMSYMFSGCSKLKSLNLNAFNTENVTTMSYMFRGCSELTQLNINEFNTAKVTNMKYMFSECSKLDYLLIPFDMPKVTEIACMFNGCSSLKTIKCDYDLSANDITNSDNTFDGCTSLKGYKNTTYSASNPKDKTYAHPDHGTAEPGYFTAYKCVYTLKVGTNALLYRYDTSFDPTNTNMEEYDPKANTNRWPSYHNDITIVSIGSSMQNAPLTSMKGLFYGGGSNYLSNLTTIQNIGYLNTENVTDMSQMFECCSKLPSLDLSTFYTANVTDMSDMFYKCKALTYLDISSFNTDNVTNMKSMFSECNALTTLDVSKFNTANVTDMRYMFDECHVLTSLNLDNFITSKITSMAYMFYNCKALKTLDLKIFDFSKVTNTSYMFFGCTNLETIICNSDLNSYGNLTTSTKMFTNCYRLKGEKGTAYLITFVDKEYARPDEGISSSKPGYFTKSTATGIDNVQSDNVQGTKVLRDGQIHILYNGTMYNVQGMKVQ